MAIEDAMDRLTAALEKLRAAIEDDDTCSECGTPYRKWIEYRGILCRWYACPGCGMCFEENYGAPTD